MSISSVYINLIYNKINQLYLKANYANDSIVKQRYVDRARRLALYVDIIH